MCSPGRGSKSCDKIDLLSDEERAALGANAGVIAISAREHIGLETLMTRLDEELVLDPLLEQRFQIPQSEGDVLAALEAGTVIHDREYEGNLVRLTVTGPASLLGRYREFRQSSRDAVKHKNLPQTKQTG